MCIICYGTRTEIRRFQSVSGVVESCWSEDAHVIGESQPVSKKTSAFSQGGPGTTGHSRDAKLESVRDRPATVSGTVVREMLERQQERTGSV